jgi:hypothetical protein
MKRAGVFGQYLRRVTRRVEGDEDHLDATGVVAETAQHLAHRRKRRRADIRALRVTKEDDDRLALKIGQTTCLTLRIGQGEVPLPQSAPEISVDLKFGGCEQPENSRVMQRIRVGSGFMVVCG